ncbi:DUF3006 domain-containing protein [Paenibacillus tuaregi]|uniref:DUF3006 domain-containing protein n=1 Tax=Paenibacillus tuaregi TaxID=1816681 RepID=UPI0008393F93|nr:DUF3006 domain-containing protein [Paenibacillus tuaregi]
MKGIVEGFEDNYCIIEIEGNSKNVPLNEVNSSVKTCDVVEWNGHEWVTNPEETQIRIKEIKSLMKDVWED